MLRLFILLLFGIICYADYSCAMQGGDAQYAEDEQDDDEEDDDAAPEDGVEVVEEDEATRELKTKQHVRSIVDSLLKINKHVEMKSSDPKVKQLMKEQNIGKQIDRLREDIKDLERTLNSHYAEIKKSSSENEAEKESANSDKKEGISNTSGKRKTRSWRSRRRSATTWRSNIHTVKNVAVPNTNSYLMRINQGRITNFSAKPTSMRKPISYRMKCYGKGGSCGSVRSTATAVAQTPTSTSYSIKKVSYFNPNCSTRSCK